MTHQQVDGRMVYRWRGWRWFFVGGVIAVVGSCISVVADLLEGNLDWIFAVRVGTAAIWVCVLTLIRDRVTADQNGIRMLHRWYHLRWADIDHVRQPRASDKVVRVMRTNGKVVPVGFPPQYAEQLAALGNVELRP
ncbi:hypothetical protein PZ938_00485 [Luteipulveratus sp. YIM 133132]|uniref:PH domain-containing protein n=1 Tax=Luteipulveratus flavus TaxID=3031728 RepID=A0ABT6C680_9MICO|nr:MULTISPECIES: hypothetical protein [unclassified Luteipulveratus]MDE9364070.1 hypothetical protein [Luteipulveratus sp. YIM 133132]MDF8263574.1 hypothetical protein [Luteipulveratus sp. YIM 133296]